MWFVMLKWFGSQCFTYVRPYTHDKLDARSVECIFMGYSAKHKGCFVLVEGLRSSMSIVIWSSLNYHILFKIVLRVMAWHIVLLLITQSCMCLLG